MQLILSHYFVMIESGYVSVLSLILCMYLYSTSQTLNAHKVTIGNMVSKMFITMMILATFVLPQASVAQRDVDLDEPPSLVDETQEIQLLDSSQTQNDPKELTTPIQDIKQPIQQARITTQAVLHHGTIAAGTLSNKIDPTTIWSYAKGGGR
jgi:hypothetical protein